MEYLVQDTEDFERRKYSNEAMRSLKKYIDYKNLKGTVESYTEILTRLDILIGNNRLRTNDEILEDRNLNKELN